MRYGVPSGRVFTESPTVRMDVTVTPGRVGTRYGDCELLGPVSVPACAAAAARIATTETVMGLRNTFGTPGLMALPVPGWNGKRIGVPQGLRGVTAS